MDEGKEKGRRMEEVQEQMTAKRILYRKKDSSWFGSDYNVNLYQGCPHGCIYCDSRSECYGVAHFSQVRAKRDALDLLQKQLASCRKGGVVATGSMSDPYNPLEEKQRLTRGMQTLLLRYSFGVSIAPKAAWWSGTSTCWSKSKDMRRRWLSSPLPHRMTVWQNSWSRTHPPPPGGCKRWNVCAHGESLQACC